MRDRIKARRRYRLAGLLLFLAAAALSGCGQKQGRDPNDGRLKVTATLFSQYDFARQVGRDRVDVELIVSAGMDSHSFEPTPSDMLDIQNSDVFLYNGGEMEYWVSEVLKSMDTSSMVTRRMMDYVDVVEEEGIEGAEIEKEHLHEGHNHVGADDDHAREIEYDEHIWTSPVNAVKMVEAIADALIEADPDGRGDYMANAKEYTDKLKALDKEFQDVAANGKRRMLIFGDKFPFRYFTDEYGLDYRAAFPGCSTDTEPSIDTMVYLIDKVKTEQIPVVYYLELSSTKIARTIAEETGARALLLHSCHNVSKEDFNKGVTYLELMEQNVINLREGLQ